MIIILFILIILILLILNYFFKNNLDINQIENNYIDKFYKSSFINIEYDKFHYIHIKNNKLPKLLLLHGYGSASLSFIELLNHIKDKFDIYLLDLPNFGRYNYNDYNKNYTQDDIINYYCNYINDFLIYTNIDKVYLIGHSFGGFIATNFTLKFPNKVSHLGLINPVGIFSILGIYGPFYGLLFKLNIIYLIRYLGNLGYLLFNKNWWYYYLSNKNVYGNKYVNKFITIKLNTVYWNHPLIFELQKIKCHIATFYGEFDNIIPSYQGKLLYDIYHIKNYIIKNSSHTPLYNEHAKEISNYIIDFFYNQKSKIIIKKNIKNLNLNNYKLTFDINYNKKIINKLIIDITNIL